MHSVENDLPVEQFPPARGQKRLHGAERAAVWFLKAPNAYWPANKPIQRPATYAGKIIYEGELGVVIGKKCFNISEAEAGDYIFGYTCVNDVTAVDLLRKDKSFEQWVPREEF